MNLQFHLPNNIGNPLTNYYANNNPSDHRMNNYHSQNNESTSEKQSNHENENIDLKQLTEKLNLNAKVFVSKKV
jgi:hypothetical protein